MTDETEISIENLPKPWTRRQYMFAMGIIGGKSGAEAARDAGYSTRTAKSLAHRMLTAVDFKHIQDFINSKQKKVAEKHEFVLDEHIRDQVRLAKMNILDFFRVDEETGNLKIDWRNVPYELGALISSVKIKQLSIRQVEGGEEISLPVLDTEFKLWDKMKAVDNLNRIHSLYEDKVNIQGIIPVRIVDDIDE